MLSMRSWMVAALGALTMLGMVSASGAGVINREESATPYDTARGWSVFVIGDGRGINSCRAVRGSGYDGQLMIDYGYHGVEAGWTVYAVANRTAADDGFGIRGAALYFDGTLFSDAQTGFGVPGTDGASTTHAGLNLTSQGLGRFKSAQTMRLDINGEASRTWSLAGSTAATLKVEECARSYGIMAAAPAAPTTSGSQTPQLAPAETFHSAFEICDFSGIRSHDGPQTSVTFQVAPDLDFPIDLLWINHSGLAENYGRLQPGESMELTTFVGHEWVAEGGGSCSYQRVYPGLDRVVFGTY